MVERPETAARRNGMRSIETIFLSIGLLVFAASLNPPRAEDSYLPAETPGPRGQAPGAVRPGFTTTGELHLNAFGKPCIQYDIAPRAHLFDKNSFDYVVAATNKCPMQIKIQICEKDRFGCGHTAVPAYQSKEVVMGFGPYTADFDYVIKETP
jgi:hypothetical protein